MPLRRLLNTGCTRRGHVQGTGPRGEARPGPCSEHPLRRPTANEPGAVSVIFFTDTAHYSSMASSSSAISRSPTTTTMSVVGSSSYFQLAVVLHEIGHLVSGNLFAVNIGRPLRATVDLDEPQALPAHDEPREDGNVRLPEALILTLRSISQDLPERSTFPGIDMKQVLVVRPFLHQVPFPSVKHWVTGQRNPLDLLPLPDLCI